MRARAATAEQRAGAPQTLDSVVERLASLGPTDHWIVSCYLKLEPRDRARGKYQIKLKNRIKAWLAWLDELVVSRVERDTVERDLERVRSFLGDPGNLPIGRGIAVFACADLDLFEAVPLPYVLRSRLAIDHSPLVRELVALQGEFGLLHCVVYDRTSARFFRLTALEAEELSRINADEPTRSGKFHGPRAIIGPGPSLSAAGEHNYNRRIHEEKERHYADIADRLFALSRAGEVRGVVLAGTRSEANAVLPHLHPYVRSDVLGTAKLNPKNVTLSGVIEAVLNLRQERERDWEAQHVRELAERLGTGWALNGLEATLGALAKGQVRTLLVDPAVAEPGYRCSETARLTTHRGGCDAEGGATRVLDVVDEAIEEALNQGGHVDVVEDDAARSEIDGLAALLRFPAR